MVVEILYKSVLLARNLPGFFYALKGGSLITSPELPGFLYGQIRDQPTWLLFMRVVLRDNRLLKYSIGFVPDNDY